MSAWDAVGSGPALAGAVIMLGRRELASASLRLSIAQGLPKEMWGGTREIIDVIASNPRKGHATELMYRVCEEADRNAITLILTCKQFQDGMTDEQLSKWYSRFGFIPIQDDPVIMARQVQVEIH